MAANPAIKVANLTSQRRIEIMRATVPWEGRIARLPSACTKIARNAWQIQVPIELEPWEVRDLELLEGTSQSEFTLAPELMNSISALMGLTMTIRVKGRTYSAPLISGLLLLRRTGQVLEFLSRSWLSDGTETYFSVTTHWTLFANIPYFDLTVQLANDYLRSPLGPAVVDHVELTGPGLVLLPWFRLENPWENIGSCLAYRDFPGDVDFVNNFVEHWQGTDHFGPFGSWGSVKWSQTTGTPLNTTCTTEFFHAIKGQNPYIIRPLMGKALQEFPMRPIHYWGLDIKLDDDIFLWELARASGDKLGRIFGKYGTSEDPYLEVRPKEYFKDGHWNPWFVPHGWTAPDTEHWSIDNLYDYYMLTGDIWARTEINTYTEALFGFMRPQKYTTQWLQAARAEGWCMKAWAQAYNVLELPKIKAYMENRLAKAEEQRFRSPDPMALSAQPIHPNWSGWPAGTRGFMTWQHGAVILGYLLAWREIEDARALTIATEVMDCMNKSLVMVGGEKKMRYYTPIRAADGASLPPNYFDNLPGQPHTGGFPGGTFQFLATPLSWLMDVAPNGAWRELATQLFKLIENPNPDIDDKWYYGVTNG